MLFLISGRDGSTGYSFFSEVATLGRSGNFDIIITAADGDRASSAVGDDTGDEVRFVALVTTRSTPCPDFGSPSRSWRAIFASIIFGGTEITSAGRHPDASVASASAPATRSSLTASTAEDEPPEAAQ